MLSYLTNRASLAGAVAACAFAAACSNGGDPQATADKLTRAVYANDLDTMVANFDDQTKKDVSRGELGEISDMMHGMGDYKSLTQRSANADSGRYEFDAAFTKGSMLVQLRIDPSGKIGAYRVAPEGTPTAAAPGAGKSNG